MTAVEFAIKMELEGEKYYLEQGEKTQHAGLKTVFTLLAAEEREHANILEKHAAQVSYELDQSQVPAHFKSVFGSERDLQVDFKARPEQLDAYNLALEKERESIVLYEKMGSEANSEEEKQLFSFLVEQEEIHYNAFQELIEHVIKAKQWVESAEFGLREDY
ncbi:MAG TPA: ferritin family protein [Limnochordia bacterium]|nr:ferritin family protein [Limnochordia bacterium]